MKRVCFTLLIFLGLSSANLKPSWALPADWSVEHGTVSVENPDPASLHFHVESEKAILSFGSFNVAASEAVEFHHHAPTPSSASLARVTGGTFSEIAGTLVSNAQLLLVNPAGIHFGPQAQVRAASFIASTLEITNADFLNGALRFRQSPDRGPALVINEGRLGTTSGLLALLGGAVETKGFLVAEVGSVALASGKKITLSLDPEGTLAIAVDEPVDQIALGLDGQPAASAIGQSGQILSSGGQVLIKAAAVERLFDRVLNDAGVTEARGVVSQGGRIELVAQGGLLDQQGSLHADGNPSHPNGGEVILKGERILQRGTITADAVGAGDGGRVVIQAEESLGGFGTISARGGAGGGSGGFADTSSQGFLEVIRAPDLTAPLGAGGLWLLDPRNIEITTTTSNTTESGGNPDTFTPTANNAKVNVAAINTALNAGTSVTVNTNNASGTQQAGNITVKEPISKTAGGAATLTLTAANNITVNDAISSTLGALSVILTANDDSSGSGDVDLNDPVTTNGGAFTSTGDVFNNTGGAVTTAGGAITINHTGNVTVGAALSSGAGAVDIDSAKDITVKAALTSTSGNVTLNAADDILLSGAGADVSTSGAFTVDADTDDDANGDYNQNNAGGAVTITNNTVSITADDFKLTGTLDAGSGNISLVPSTGITIGLGSESGNFRITDAEFDRITTTGTLTIGSNGSGAIALDDLTLGAKNVTLVSGGTINDDDDSGTSVATTGTLTLTSNGAIGNLGGAQGLNTDAGSLAVTSTGGNNLTVRNAGTSDLTLTNVATGGAGTIAVTQAANDLLLGLVSTTGSLTLTSAAAIEESGADAASDLIGDAATLTAATGIGSLAALETTLASLTASVTGTGSINLAETDALTLLSISAASGAVTLAALGDLSDGNAAATNLSATADSSLTASGVIGSSADSIEVSVTGAALSVAPSGQSGGVSAALSGTVTPSNTLTVAGSPPGQVIFNGVVIFPAAAAVSSPAPAAAAAADGLLAGTGDAMKSFFSQVTSLLFASESQRRRALSS